jgi:phage-related tail fiber protein
MPLKSRGLLAGRPVNCLPGDEYTATNTQQKFTCFAAGVWTLDTTSTIDALSWKQAVRIATTGNLASLSGNQTIDGVLTVTGNRVLVKNQVAGQDNGIYITAAGAWTRATDADASAEVKDGLAVVVGEGTVNADTGWQLTTNDPITLGVTALVFAKLFPNLHGQDYQTAIATARTTTTSSTFQTKATLTTPAGLNGTYRVGWACSVDNTGSPASNLGEVRLQNVTDVATLNGPRIYQGGTAAERKTESGFAEVVMAGAAKTFELQFRDQAGGNTQGIEDARIEFYRVS